MRRYIILKRYRMLLKRLVAICLVFGLLNVMPAYATESSGSSLNETDIESSIEKDFPLLLWSLQQAPSVYGLSQADLSGVKLLSPVRFVTGETSEDDLVNQKGLHALYFPMMNSNGEIVAIYTIIKTDNYVNATMGVDFAPLLEQLRNEGISDVVLAQDENGIFALTENGRSVYLDGNEITRNSAALSFEYDSTNYPYVSLNLEAINENYSDKAEQAVNNFYP